MHICAGLGPGNLNERFNTNWNGPFLANDVGYWIARNVHSKRYKKTDLQKKEEAAATVEMDLLRRG